MKVIFLQKFYKDLDKIKQSKDKKAIVKIIEKVKSADSVKHLAQTKKLTGFKDAYRIRTGDLRIGIFVNKKTVEFARIAYRKDIYKVFP